LLIRHAKSAQGGGPDIDRPLADRGRADAPAIGRWLAAHDLVPDHVVVSPARRAAQTWELAAGALPAAVATEVDARVYDNTVGDLLDVIRETPADVGTLALVGHNPSFAELAGALDDGQGDRAARRELADKYPTSGVAAFELATEWSRTGLGDGTLRAFAAPRG